MNVLKLKRSIYLIITLVVTGILATSCEKEIIIEDDIEGVKEIIIEEDVEGVLAKFPKEITIDNWEKFVYAPKEVLDYFQQKELNAMLTKDVSESNDAKYFKDFVIGRVQAFRANAWRGMRGVSMTNSCSNFNTDTNGLYVIDDDCGSVCATFNNSNNDAINGVSTLDLVLIQRHILGITPFTDTRQVIAADVNRDNQISAADIAIVRQLVLGIIINWANSDNLVFLPEFEYDEAQTLMPEINTILANYGSYSSCSTPIHPNRNVIKTGDVNGTFNF